MKSYGQRRSQLQEKRIAKELGGRVQKASGASKFAKGDVVADGILVEAKTTSLGKYRIKLKELQKIQSEALEKSFLVWVFQIEFQGAGGGAGSRYSIITGSLFEEMYLGSPFGTATGPATYAKAGSIEVTHQELVAGISQPWLHFPKKNTVGEFDTYILLKWQFFEELWKWFKTKMAKDKGLTT